MINGLYQNWYVGKSSDSYNWITFWNFTKINSRILKKPTKILSMILFSC